MSTSFKSEMGGEITAPPSRHRVFQSTCCDELGFWCQADLTLNASTVPKELLVLDEVIRLEVSRGAPRSTVTCIPVCEYTCLFVLVPFSTSVFFDHSCVPEKLGKGSKLNFAFLLSLPSDWISVNFCPLTNEHSKILVCYLPNCCKSLDEYTELS